MPKKPGKSEMQRTIHPEQPAVSFETALERLETIVTKLEEAEVPLEKALTLYEEGVGLARFCSEQLRTAERRVELLEEKNGQLQGRAFFDPADSLRDEAREADVDKTAIETDEADETDDNESEDEDEDEDSTTQAGRQRKKSRDQESLF